MRRALPTSICVLGLGLSLIAQSREAEFKKLAQQIVAQRQASGDEKNAPQERALALLDEVAIAAMNTPQPTAAPSLYPYLGVVNSALGALRAEQMIIGESFQIVPVLIPATPQTAPVYAAAVNFSLSGPSAVRLYAPTAIASQPPTPGSAAPAYDRWSNYKLAGRIDRFSHTDFFDEYLEVLPVNPAAGVFVTVTGRTDDRKTGAFTAWRIAGRELSVVWSSDLLEHSRYEAKDGELRIEYCAEADDDKPAVCKKMLRDRYIWRGSWTRTQQEDVTPKTMNQ